MVNKSIIRKNITSFIRGYYFTNIFCSLVEIGILRSDKKLINLSNNRKLIKKDRVVFALEYLTNLGLLRKRNQNYIMTGECKQLVERYGAFQIPFSYKNYLSNTSKFIVHGTNFSCERSMNVIGSGDTHSRKFFQPVIKQFDFTKYDQIVDLGCGDGTFLSELLKNNKKLNIFASDISDEALSNTKKKLNPYKNVNYIKSDALDVNRWSKKIKINKKTLVCFWFIIHEIFTKKNNSINSFFKKLKNKNFDILICEINRVDSNMLKKNLDYTLMPEYYYFHDISDQQLFSRKDLYTILKNNSYKRVAKFDFDKFRQIKSNVPSIYTEVYSIK